MGLEEGAVGGEIGSLKTITSVEITKKLIIRIFIGMNSSNY